MNGVGSDPHRGLFRGVLMPGLSDGESDAGVGCHAHENQRPVSGAGI